MRLLFLLIAACLVASGCNNTTPPQDVLMKTPGPMPSISGSPAVMKSGVKTWDVQVGKGAPLARGQQATIHFVGYLADGSRFESTRATGHPYVFKVGANDVLPGLSEGIVGMKLDGRRRIEIPPAQAYGEEGRPPVIPPNSTLIFDVELQVVK